MQQRAPTRFSSHGRELTSLNHLGRDFLLGAVLLIAAVLPVALMVLGIRPPYGVSLAVLIGYLLLCPVIRLRSGVELAPSELRLTRGLLVVAFVCLLAMAALLLVQ